MNIPNSSNTNFVYVWINKGDPSASGNTNIPSDVVTVLNSNGLMSSASNTSTKSVPNGSIIQYTGNIYSNSNLYYVYNKQPLNVTNNTNSQISIRTRANSNDTISGSSPSNITSNTCPANINFPSDVNSSPTNSAVIIIPPTGNNSSTIVSAFPYLMGGSNYTEIDLWKGSAVN